MKISIYKPELPPYELIEPDIRHMYSSGMLYPDFYTERLVDAVKSYCDVKFVQPVSSCSMGLILLLNTLSKGSKVLIPAFTFNATLQAVEWNDLTPVVIDVTDDGQMDKELAESYFDEMGAPSYDPDFNHNVGAIMPVHMWGNLCDTSYYRDLHHMFDVPVFYDGAHVLGSFGSEQIVRDKRRVVPGQATVFSIAATKPISAGEGGLVVTNDVDYYSQVRDAAFHGYYGSLDTRVRGTNGKIQEFNSILAYHSLGRADSVKTRRRELMEFYRSGFIDLPLRIWEPREPVSPMYKDCVLFTDQRDALSGHMQQRGIGTKQYFTPAVPDMGSFKGEVHSADNARKLAATCLTIPLYPSLTDNDAEYIVKVVKDFYGNKNG